MTNLMKKKAALILSIAFTFLCSSCSKDIGDGPSPGAFEDACISVFKEKPKPIIECGSLYYEDTDSDPNCFGLLYEEVPFYGFLDTDYILEKDGIVVRYMKYARSDEDYPFFRFEIKNDGTYFRLFDSPDSNDDTAAEDISLIRKYINSEINFRHQWYKEMNGTSDINSLENKVYSWKNTKQIEGIIVPTSEFEAEYIDQNKGNTDIFVFDFQIPASKNTSSRPYFIYDWRPYGLNSIKYGFGYQYNREIQKYAVDDGVCSYLYGVACTYDDCAVMVFAYENSDDARNQVKSFCNTLNLPMP